MVEGKVFARLIDARQSLEIWVDHANRGDENLMSDSVSKVSNVFLTLNEACDYSYPFHCTIDSTTEAVVDNTQRTYESTLRNPLMS